MTVEREDAGAHGPMDAKARAFGDGNYIDNSVVTALAALARAAIGGVMTVFASWLTQRAQAQAPWIATTKFADKSFTENSSSSLRIGRLATSARRLRAPAACFYRFYCHNWSQVRFLLVMK